MGMFRRLVELGGDVNGPTNKGFIPIFIAAQHGYFEAIRTLAELAGNVNRASNGGPSQSI